MKYLSIFIRVALLALGQLLDCHSASKVSLMDVGKSVNVYPQQSTAKQKPCAYFLGYTEVQMRYVRKEVCHVGYCPEFVLTDSQTQPLTATLLRILLCWHVCAQRSRYTELPLELRYITLFLSDIGGVYQFFCLVKFQVAESLLFLLGCLNSFPTNYSSHWLPSCPLNVYFLVGITCAKTDYTQDHALLSATCPAYGPLTLGKLMCNTLAKFHCNNIVMAFTTVFCYTSM